VTPPTDDNRTDNVPTSRRESLTRADVLEQPPTVHPVVAKTFEVLDEAGVSWCLLRGETRLASPPHDVDILVPPADLRRVTEVLASVGFAAVPTWARGSHRFFVAHEPDAGGWLQIDTVTELAYGPHYAIQTDASAGCLKRRERIGPLTLLSADDAFWTLMLHCVLDRDDIPPHQKQRLEMLAPLADTSGELGQFIAEAGAPAWHPRRVLECVSAAKWTALDELRTTVINGWVRKHPLRFYRRVIAGAIGWRAQPLHTGVRMRGLRLAIIACAPDEAAAVASSLADSFYFPVSIREWEVGMNAAALASRQQARGNLVVFATSSREVGARDDHLRAGMVRRAAHAFISPDVVIAIAPARPASLGFRRGRTVVETLEGGPAAPDAVTAIVWRAYCERRGWSANRR
jgi:hypothetical protein